MAGSSYSRYHHSAWKNGCDTLTAVGLHENWTLALRCQVSGVSSENARVGLTPEARNLKPLLGKGFIMPDNVQK
jgi:hypothetical protein